MKLSMDRGVRIAKCPIGFEYCYPSCYWREGDRCCFRSKCGKEITTSMAMELKTRIFELSNRKYTNLTELARAMGISACQVSRVSQGKRRINQKFIVGAMKAFPPV